MNYLLYGSETYRLKKKLDELLKANDPENTGMNTVVYEAGNADFQLRAVLEDAWTIPFFAEKKTVVVRNPVFLTTSGSLNEKDGKALEEYLNHSCPSTDLIFCGEFENLDQRKKLVKLAVKTCRVFTMKRLDEREFRSYVNQQLSAHPLILSREAMDELMQRLPLDLDSFHQERIKLTLFGTKISRDDVVHLVSRPLDEDVFHLVNAVITHDLKQAMHLWHDLDSLNKDPIYLVALLASQFRLRAQVRMLSDRRMSESMIAQQLKVHPFRVKKAHEAVARLNSERLLEILNDLAELDQRFKSGTLDRRLGFEMFLIKAAH